MLARPASEIGISPSLLASSAIMWASKAEVHPFEIKGSANWALLPKDIQDEREELCAQLEHLTADIKASLRRSGIDPESAVHIAAVRASTLTRRLRKLDKKIQGVWQRRSRLLTEVRKYQIEAYYQRRIRRRKIDDAGVNDLIKRALNDDENYFTTHRRIPTQKMLYDWVRAVERVFDAFILE